MTVKPMKNLATKHVAAIGFKTKKAKKDLLIMLDPKDQDWRCKLILAYYSMSLVPALLIEGCLATLIKSSVRNGTYEVGKPVDL